MSRCFPYSPPGYVKNWIRDEALIESIKLQREEERARKERKKEKQREKKEKAKALKDGEMDHTRQRHKKRPREERSQKDRKGRDHHNEKKAEAENIEKSSLTEEHGHPVDSQNSSDSTLNSSKRLKQSSPQESRHSSESVFRIRLPLQRQKDPEVLPNCLPLQRQKDPEVLPSKASASRRTDAAIVQGVCEPASRPGRDLGEPSRSTSGNVGQELIFRIRKEKSFSSSEAANSFAHMIEPVAPSIVSSGRSPTEVSQFRDLIENWVPPPIQSEDDEFHDLEWLLGTKQKLNHAVERCKVGSDSSIDQIFTPWLHARYMPEVDISALPYTVPF